MFFTYFIEMPYFFTQIIVYPIFILSDPKYFHVTCEMEHFVIIVNSWKPLTIITKSSILDVAAVLDPPLEGEIEGSQTQVFGKKSIPFQLISVR